jgi:hypothetical protein
VITSPCTWGCSLSQRSALSVLARKLSTGQQPLQESAWRLLTPATTAAVSGCQEALPSGLTCARKGSSLSGSWDVISIG